MPANATTSAVRPANALMQPRIDGTMQATPRNALLGYIADALNAANNYANKPNPAMPMGKANPPLSLLASALGIGDLGATADNLSYGRNLTQGQGMARQMLPETQNALLTAGPLAAKFPKQAAAVTAGLLSGDTAAARAAMVWHGSPHKFDKFDSSKIGTGEGAQAYGHGLYLAESPDVAKGYQKTLSADGFLTGDGRVFDPQSSLGHVNVKVAARKGDLDGAIAKARAIAESDSPVANIAAADLATLQQVKASGGLFPNTGSLYKVDLPDSAISRMLDWDKPLSQQAPSVRAAVMATKKQLTPDDIENLGGAAAVRALYDPANKIDNFLGTWESLRGKRDAGETLLRQQGIPGIRYLDGGSRGAGVGSSNFVVFPGEENILQILERNGVPMK